MKRADIRPDNYEAVFDYFAAFEPNPTIQNIGFAAMHLAYASELYFLGDSQGRIGNHIADGGQVGLTPNHQSNVDTPTLGGLVYHPTFEPIKATTIIPAKREVMVWPVIGKFFRHMHAHPTFQGRDFSDEQKTAGLPEKTGQAVKQFNIDYINSGGNMAIFSEGHRNKGDVRTVQELKPGIADISLGIDKPGDFLVIPLGFAYKGLIKLRLPGGKCIQLPHSPVITVAEPFCPADMSHDEVREHTRAGMQKATDNSFDLAT